MTEIARTILLAFVFLASLGTGCIEEPPSASVSTIDISRKHENVSRTPDETTSWNRIVPFDPQCFEFDHHTMRDGKSVLCRMLWCGMNGGPATLWCAETTVERKRE
jgi:hypothetical protein